MEIAEARKNITFLRTQLINSIKNDDWSVQNMSDRTRWSSDKFSVLYDPNSENVVYTISTHIEHNNGVKIWVEIDFDVLAISKFRMYFLRQILKRKGISSQELKDKREFEYKMIEVGRHANKFMSTYKGVVREDKLKDILQ